MTTTTSSFSIFKNTIKQLKGISLISLLLYIVTFTIQIFNTNLNEYLDRYFLSSGFSLVFYLLNIAFAIGIGVTTTSFMHKKNLGIIIHSLPIKREQIFLESFLASCVAYCIPVLLTYILTFSLISREVPIEFDMLVSQPAFALLVGISLIALTFLTSSLTSSSFDSFLFSAGFSVIIPCFTILHQMMKQSYVLGNSFFDTGSMVQFSPTLIRFYAIFRYDLLQEALPLIIACIIQIVVFLIIGILAYKNRNNEICENQSLKPIIYKFLVITMSFGIAVISGAIYEINFNSSLTFAAIIVIITAFASSIVLNSLLSRNFKQTIHSYITIILSVVLSFIYFFILTSTSYFGEETFVPDTEDISSVSVSFYNSAYPDVKTGDYSTDIVFKNSDNILLVENLHKELIELSINKDSYDVYYDYVIDIVYTLTNGKKISKYYSRYITADTAEILNALYESDEFKSTGFFENFTTDSIIGVKIDGQNLNLNKNELNCLFAAMKLDEQNKSFETSKGYIYNKITIAYNFGEFPINSTFIVNSYSKHTIQTLKDMGYGNMINDTIPDNHTLYISQFNNKEFITLFKPNPTSIFKIDLDNDYFSQKITDKDEILKILSNGHYYSNNPSDFKVAILVPDNYEVTNENSYSLPFDQYIIYQ